MKKIIVLLGLFFFFTAKPAFAWEINTFDSKLTVQTDGTVDITETIVVDFGSEDKHGIYRDIPYAYEDEGGIKTYTKIDIRSVKQNLQKAQTKVTTEDNYVRIRIGDPDQTIQGKHTYVISYIAAGILRSYDNHDELYWNATGNYWDVPMGSATASVVLPKGVIEKIACYEGYSGSRAECTYSLPNEKTATYNSTEILEAAEGMTIVAGYTKGAVPILTIEPPARWEDTIFSKESFIVAFTAFILGSSIVLWRWLTKGRDFWFKTRQILDPNVRHEVMPIGAHETTVVEFEPPQKLRPAEIGVLMDERADTLDVTATIIDLATRGYLTITEVPKKWLFGSTDYTLTATNGDMTKLLRYEKMLLDRLFSGKNELKLSSLKTQFYDDLAQIKTQLYQDIMSKKLFVGNPERTRNMHLGLSIGTLFLGGFLIFIGANLELAYLMSVSAGIILSGLLGIIFSQLMPQRTAAGRELYQRAMGYKMFISGAEQYRQQFAEKKNLFNEVLPYTIVFGLTGKFADAMKDMGIQSNTTTWYSGTKAFNTHMFVGNVHSFSNAMSTAIASTPSKNGGFSSGGSSGGGFGGGGGGSW